MKAAQQTEQRAATPEESKFDVGKYGLRENPIGHHVSLTVKGRTYLGTVKDAQYNSTLGVIQLTVYHFNGEPWPFKPTALAVDVIR